MKLTQMRHATFYRFSMYNTEMCHHWCINSREWWNANFWRSILRILAIYTFNFPGTIATSCLPFPRAPDGLLSQTVNLFTKWLSLCFQNFASNFVCIFYFSKCHTAINYLMSHFRKLSPGTLHSLYPRPNSKLLLFPLKIWDSMTKHRTFGSAKCWREHLIRHNAAH